FCSVYLEIQKPTFGESMDSASYAAVLDRFESICILLHPFMPFITEEIWHQLRDRSGRDDCMLTQVTRTQGQKEDTVQHLLTHILTVKTAVMELRNQYQLSPRETMVLVFPHDPVLVDLWNVPGAEFILAKLANATCAEGVGSGVSFLAGKYQYHAALNIEVDAAAEIARMQEELA